MAQLRDMEMAFDGFFEKHHLKLQQYLQLLQYEMSFHEVQTSVGVWKLAIALLKYCFSAFLETSYFPPNIWWWDNATLLFSMSLWMLLCTSLLPADKVKTFSALLLLVLQSQIYFSDLVCLLSLWSVGKPESQSSLKRSTCSCTALESPIYCNSSVCPKQFTLYM